MQDDRVTLADVARLAGVDKATASRALAGRSGVRPATRERIEQAAKQTGYVAHPALASLVSMRQQRAKQQMTRIALLTRRARHLHDVNGTHRLLSEIGRSRGYEFEHLETWQEADAGRFGRRLHAMGFTGILIYRVLQEPEWFADFPWELFVSVSLDASFVHHPIPIVRSSQFEDVVRAWQKMQAAGYRRIGAVLPTRQDRRIENRRRLAAVQECQRDAPSREQIPPYEFSFFDLASFDRVKEWLQQYRPDSLLVLLPSVIEWIRNVVPDLDLPYAALTTPSDKVAGLLASRTQEHALEFIDLLVRSGAYGLPKFPVHHVLSPPWQEGASLPPNS